MLKKIIRIEKEIEKPAYVKDSITNEIRPIIGNEFQGENITSYKIILLNYFEIGLNIYPIEGKIDRIIPFWFWTEKQAISAKYVIKFKEQEGY